MKKFKKSVAFVTTAALLAGTPGFADLGMSVAHAAELPELLVNFDFEGLEANQEMTWEDSAKAVGNYTVGESYVEDSKALHLNGKNQFLKVTDQAGGSLLNGKEELTVSFEAEHEQDGTNWVMFAAKDSSAPVYMNEHYVGILRASLQGGALQVERYNSYNEGRPASAQTANPLSKEWAHIDVVLKENETVIYVNGKEDGRMDSSVKLSELFGANSILQIGKANWGNGEYFKGSIDNFKIYDGVLTEEQIAAQYQNYMLECDAAALTIPGETKMDLVLPTTGENGQTSITWKSNNKDVITDDGKVTRPEVDTVVIMTATLTAGGQTITKQFAVTVKKVSPEEDLAAYTEELTLNAGFVSKDLKLPSKIGTATVKWSSLNKEAITDDGKVTRTDKNQNVTLKATLHVDGAKEDAVKEISLIVLAKGTDVATYISKTPATGQNGGMKIAAEGKESYKVLHKNQPILYSSVGNKKFAAPEIFRKADGTFGVVAADGGANGSIVLYDSNDLINYTGQRLVSLEGISRIDDIDCVYDSSAELYKLFVKVGDSTYVVKSKNLTDDFTKAEAVSYTFEEMEDVASDAVVASETALTKEEYEVLKAKFTTPFNTSAEVSGLQDITIKAGETFKEKLAGTYTAEYSDGTKTTYDVKWDASDIAKVNTNKPGTYTVNGTMGGSAYYTDANKPLVEERADPYVVYNEDDGYYYFTASYPVNGKGGADGYDRLILRRAKTIAGLAEAEEVVIWDESEAGDYHQWIWAPELHKIGDSWYFISTAGLGNGNFNIRPFMIKCNNPNDMMNPDSWGEPERVKAMKGDEKKCLNAMSLDMSYFEAGGRHYLVWADLTQGPSSLYIATIDPENPTQLTSPCTIITAPEYSWEVVRYTVNEGASVIQKDGKVYLAFSASGTGSEYCVGLLTGNAEDDLTVKANWEKTPYPIMTSADFNDEVSGPGHNSFTVDKYGNPVIVYHSRPTEAHAGHSGDPLYDPCRHCYVKPVFFDSEGKPVLNQSDEEFAGAAKQVSVKVTVEGEAAEKAPVLEYNFNETYEAGTAKDSAGKNDAVLTEGASYVKDNAYGQVLYLDGDKKVGGHNSFLSFPEGFFDGKDYMTISMDVKGVSRSGNYFTFALGQDDQKYMFMKTEPTYTKLALTKETWSGEAVAGRKADYPNNSKTWRNIKIVVTPTSIGLYQDGKLIAENLSTGTTITDLEENLKAYLGKSFYSGDKYFRGYFDNVKVYDHAMTDEEVKDCYTQEEEARIAAMEDVNRVAESFDIPNADEIKGNITLPSEKDGVSIKWESSNEDIISTKTVENKGYDATPAGVVSRPEKDTKVTLTAVFSQKGVDSVEKQYEVTVKAKPQEIAEEEYVGYLFVHFTGTEASINDEQTYFSLSKDGLNWEDLNDNKPVLPSTFGESGLRDHYIARSPEGDKFYMIATDLSIYNNRSGNGATGWWGAGGSGSHSIVVWESDDLVNWSEPWLSEIAPEGAGCTWAPEFVYDDITGEYIVYWASTTLEVDENENITQNYENHTIYYSKTRDFRTFTDAEVYHAGGKDANGKIVKVIDSTMIENDGTYYRYTKNESKGIIEVDKADAVLGEFTGIESKTLSTDLMNKQGAVEGPIIFKLNEKTEDGKDQWCLMVDRFARGQGYYPLITSDLESGEFRMLDNSEFSMPSKYRHGYVMPVTAAEYSALQRKWGKEDPEEVKTDKELLNELIGYAESQKESPEYANVIPVVKEVFEKALAEAEAVSADAKATQAEVDAAYDKLLTMTHYLGFVGNSSNLKVLVDEAKGLNEKLYTEETWAVLKDTLAKAEEVLANENALQEEIDAAAKALQSAMDALEKLPVDKSKLEKLVAKSQKYEIVIAQYTPATAEIFKGALAHARDILANEDATQENVDAAYEALQNAIFGLRIIPNKDKLEDLIGVAKKVDVSKYSAESAAAFQSALEKAELIFADENATEEQVKAAEKALKTAQKNLVAKADADKKGGDKVASADGNSKSADNKATKTGDEAQTTGVMMTMVMAAAAAVLSFRRKEKR